MSNSIEQVGICDEVIENENEINFMVNKIGGLPVSWANQNHEHIVDIIFFPQIFKTFLPQKMFDIKPCENCSNPMVLITQLYCPLVNSVYHRVFYLMACVKQSCWNKLNRLNMLIYSWNYL